MGGGEALRYEGGCGVMRYYIIQTTAQGIRPLPYTEAGFDTRLKARRYLNQTGESWCRIIGRVS
jgi:hypothetical protein